MALVSGNGRWKRKAEERSLHFGRDDGCARVRRWADIKINRKATSKSKEPAGRRRYGSAAFAGIFLLGLGRVYMWQASGFASEGGGAIGRGASLDFSSTEFTDGSVSEFRGCQAAMDLFGAVRESWC